MKQLKEIFGILVGATGSASLQLIYHWTWGENFCMWLVIIGFIAFFKN